MQTRIEQHPDFALLEAIKSLMQDPVRAQYRYVSIFDQWERFMGTKQQPEEPLLLNYVNRYKQARELFKTMMGKDFLSGFIETMNKEYKEGDSDEKARLKKVCVAELIAYDALRNCEQAKYGNLTSGLQEQFGTDQYPKAIQNTMDVLRNHSFDAKHNKNQKRNCERATKEHQSTDDESKTASFAEQGKPPIC
jgi:hypothetical protein